MHIFNIGDKFLVTNSNKFTRTVGGYVGGYVESNSNRSGLGAYGAHPDNVDGKEFVIIGVIPEGHRVKIEYNADYACQFLTKIANGHNCLAHTDLVLSSPVYNNSGWFYNEKDILKGTIHIRQTPRWEV